MANNESSRRYYTDVMFDSAPALLWHYTDGPGLVGIATTRSLWCTDYRYLNDRKEMMTYAGELQTLVRKALKDVLSTEDLNSIIERSNLFITWYVFVCAFCPDGDSNVHW